MSASEDADVTAPALTSTDEESALFSTANSLLGILTTRLLDRPHGQISLVQLPDVFLIKAHLEQLVEIEAKKVKLQETQIQMAIDRDEEGGKVSRKRAKTSGTQTTVTRQIFAEEFEKRDADRERYIASLEDQAKRHEKLLGSAMTDIRRLTDEVKFL